MSIRLTLFYDATCPLCVREMRSLQSHDTEKHIKLVDIFSPEFAAYPDIDPKAASDRLHAYDADGNLLLGLDVTHRAWSLVGKPYLYAFTRWPIMKPVCDWAYLKFAKNRYHISGWLTGKKRCERCRLE